MQKVLSILSVLSVSCKCKHVIIMRSLKGEVQNDVPIRGLSEIDPHQQSTCSFCSAAVRVRSAHCQDVASAFSQTVVCFSSDANSET